jgi:DnaJ-class molecular chaperone
MAKLNIPKIAPLKPAAPAAAPPPPGPLDAAGLSDLEQRYSQLDGLDYFDILKLQKGASPEEIKRAFHRESRVFHPDRFYAVDDAALKNKVHELYKKITESYFVLRDDRKRKKYLADVSGPEREQKLRFTEATESETKQAVKKEQEEQIGTHPKGRQFYSTGAADFAAGRHSAAERNFKMALTYEPQNPRYKEMLAQAQQKLYEQQKGDPFKIK